MVLATDITMRQMFRHKKNVVWSKIIKEKKKKIQAINLLSVTDGISRLPLSTLNCDQRLLPFVDFKSSSLAGIIVNERLPL